MPQEKVRKIHLLYGWATAVLVLVLTAALIASCIDIYQSGDRPFSREVMTQAARNLAVPGLICLVAVFGGILLQVALPLKPDKNKRIPDEKTLLLAYSSRFSHLPDPVRAEARRQQAIRRRNRIILWGCAGILSLIPIVYFADSSHFGVADITSDILWALFTVLIPLLVIFPVALWQQHRETLSIHTEISLYKTAGIQPDKVTLPTKKTNVAAIRIAGITAAVVLLILGILNEGYVDVLGKAIKICTECIGLG